MFYAVRMMNLSHKHFFNTINLIVKGSCEQYGGKTIESFKGFVEFWTPLVKAILSQLSHENSLNLLLSDFFERAAHRVSYKAFFHIFQCGYSEEYCSTCHIVPPVILFHLSYYSVPWIRMSGGRIKFDLDSNLQGYGFLTMLPSGDLLNFLLDR